MRRNGHRAEGLRKERRLHVRTASSGIGHFHADRQIIGQVAQCLDEVLSPARQAQVPEAVDVDDLGLDPSVSHLGHGRGQGDQRIDLDAGSDLLEVCRAGGESRRHRREDVAPVECGAGGRAEPQRPVVELPRVGDAAHRLRAEHQQAVVGAHQRVATRHAQRHRSPLGANPGIHHGEVHPGGHEWECGAQDEGAVPHRELPNAVGDIDDLEVRGDRQHDACP